MKGVNQETMVRLSAYRGNVLHAPENSRVAFLSAYTAGADVLELDVQLSGDGQPVVASPTALTEMSGGAGKIEDFDLSALRKIDFGAKFHVRGSSANPWKRDPPLARIETLGGMLDQLPADVFKVIQVHVNGAAEPDDLVRKVIDALKRRGLINRALLCSASLDVLSAAQQREPEIALALVAPSDMTPDSVRDLRDEKLSGLVLELDKVLDEDGELTPLAETLKRMHESGQFPLGVIVRTQTVGGAVSPKQYDALNQVALFYAVSFASTQDAVFSLRLRELEKASFAGEKEDNTARFHFGYAKPNRFAHVYQKNGVHVEIKPYEGPPPISSESTGDEVKDKLNSLQEQAWAAMRNWPFYSGGGFGTAFGIDGDFFVQVDFSLEITSQATMCEMAAINIDPAKHRPGWRLDEDGKKVANVPDSFRDIDTFFDPHGAPPFVGVEHDEDDGYRINHNLGTQYENNRYGRPHGNGHTKTGSFRLERRGPYFAAYYKDEENSDWVCCGAARNDSLNSRVYIRCAGKRWRQESGSGIPGEYFPIPANHIVFKNFIVWTRLR